MTPQVLTGERTGPVVTYEPALTIKRQVFISDRFKAEFSEAAGLLRTMVVGTSWHLLDTPDAFQTAKTRANQKKVNATVVGIFTDVEVRACGPLPAWMKKHIFNRGSFLKFIERLCLPRSNIGVDQV